MGYTTQYNPVATVEAAANDALSVRAIRDLTDSINNMTLIEAPLLVDAFPESSTAAHEFLSTSGNTGEDLISPIGMLYVGQATNRLHVMACGVRTNGSASIVVKVHAGWYGYKGPTEGIAAADLLSMGPYTTSTLTINSDSDNVYVDTSQVLFANPAGWVFLMLTMTNGDGTTQGQLYSLAIRPWRSEA